MKQKKAAKALERDVEIVRQFHRLRAKLPTGTRRIELDLKFADGQRIRLVSRG